MFFINDVLWKKVLPTMVGKLKGKALHLCIIQSGPMIMSLWTLLTQSHPLK